MSRERVLRAMAAEGVDVLLLGREGNARYVSGAQRLFQLPDGVHERFHLGRIGRKESIWNIETLIKSEVPLDHRRPESHRAKRCTQGRGMV